ncbi:PAS domain S-box protein [Halorubrum sp. PV6]|uniref:hybrid sensor histidine kinase/response regulator n=1 Tax=Halorubrum sp. PV6 TaxID=634157 RepID=UPI000F85489B|nr:PAS domain S-box protein [Halorubrum sp. PV6]AZQ14994.1 hybrid sensor histidine kinase/response regulator [Halorubrum sp. PV6]
MDAEPDSIAVLHVDDEPDFAEVAAAFLEREDARFDVTTATSGTEGLDRLDAAEFHCVVSDYDMPGHDGIEFLEAVRETHPDLPFILYTGKGSEEVASDAISAGVTDYIQKKRNTDQYALLANRIQNAVDANRSRHIAQERTRRLETLISNLPGMVYRCLNEPEWPMETVSGDVEELTGYSADAIESDDLLWGEDILHPSDREAMWTTVQEGLSADGTFEVSYRIVTKAGARKWMWERGRGVYADDGQLDALEGFITDITAQKERERELQRTKSRLEALYEDSPDMINVHDSDGAILDANAQLCEKLGYAESELVGMNVWDIDKTISPDEAHTLWTDMAVGERREIGGTYQCRDGTTFPAKIHIRRLDSGEGDRFVVISRDISAQHERERSLQAERDRLDEFASVVSHDIRNPLNIAEGRLRLLREECDSDHLDPMDRALTRMDELIENLLTLARGGDYVSETEPVDLAEIAAASWRNVDTAEAAIRAPVDRTVRADRSRLTQLLENLFRNAVEHGGDDVTVTVDDFADGFYVEDDGPGLPADACDDVFGGDVSPAGDDTGLGLRIVAQIASAHGWDVRATEGTDGGARFEITLADESGE